MSDPSPKADVLLADALIYTTDEVLAEWLEHLDGFLEDHCHPAYVADSRAKGTKDDLDHIASCEQAIHIRELVEVELTKRYNLPDYVAELRPKRKRR